MILVLQLCNVKMSLKCMRELLVKVRVDLCILTLRVSSDKAKSGQCAVGLLEHLVEKRN